MRSVVSSLWESKDDEDSQRSNHFSSNVVYYRQVRLMVTSPDIMIPPVAPQERAELYSLTAY